MTFAVSKGYCRKCKTNTVHSFNSIVHCCRCGLDSSIDEYATGVKEYREEILRDIDIMNELIEEQRQKKRNNGRAVK